MQDLNQQPGQTKEFTYINRQLTLILKLGGKLLGELESKGLALDRRLSEYDHCVR